MMEGGGRREDEGKEGEWQWSSGSGVVEVTV